MKIRTNRAELADALNWVGQAIPKKPSVPSLAGIRLTAEADSLTISAFDYETSHVARVAADVATEGECLVPGTFLRSLVAGMRGKEVELVQDAAELAVTSGRSAYRARTLSLADYPSTPEMPGRVGTLDAGDLLAALAVATHPADDASPHEQVRGLRIEAGGGRVDLVGMDRFRIATARLDWDGNDVALTVPARGLLAAAKGMAGQVVIGVRDGSLGLSDGERTVVQRTFGEGFTPMWSRLLEADPDGAHATVDAADLLAAVRRAGGLSDDETPIALAFDDGEVTVSVDAAGTGAGEDVLDAETTGEAGGLLSAGYLGEALAVIPSGPVRITQPRRQGPWLLDPLDHDHIRLAVMGKKGKS